MSSDSSSSDSEVNSDEELDNNILKAFKAVNTCLNSAGVLKNKEPSATSEGPRPSNQSQKKIVKPSSLRHKLIYQTFHENSNEKTEDVKILSKNDKNEATKVESHSDSDAAPNLTNFFIDKGPSVSADIREDDVVAYDLTNIGDTGNSEVEDTEDVVSFDLTNLEDSVPDNVKCNDNVQEWDNNCQNLKDPNDESRHVNMRKGNNKKKKKGDNCLLSSRLEANINMKNVYIDVDPLSKPSKKRQGKLKHKEPEIMKKSVITEDFERQDSIQTTHVSVRQQKKQNKLERAKTKGDKWYNLPATELTDERKHDLQVIQMRKVLDPKRFYRSHDMKTAPKYFQFGQVVEDATDFYGSRIPKKQRKSTVVEELLADAEFRRFNKRKFEEVQEAKRLGKGPYKHMKRLKKHRR